MKQCQTLYELAKSGAFITWIVLVEEITLNHESLDELSKKEKVRV